MWPIILLMSRLPGGHSRSESRRPEKLGYQQSMSADRHSQVIGANRTQQSVTRVKGPQKKDNKPQILQSIYTPFYTP